MSPHIPFAAGNKKENLKQESRQGRHLAGVQNGAVACAATQVAVQGFLHVLWLWQAAPVLMLAEGGMAGHNHAGRAEAALAAMVSGNRVCAEVGTLKRLSTHDIAQGLRQVFWPASAPLASLPAEHWATAQKRAGLAKAALGAAVFSDGVRADNCAGRGFDILSEAHIRLEDCTGYRWHLHGDFALMLLALVLLLSSCMLRAAWQAHARLQEAAAAAKVPNTTVKGS